MPELGLASSIDAIRFHARKQDPRRCSPLNPDSHHAGENASVCFGVPLKEISFTVFTNGQAPNAKILGLWVLSHKNKMSHVFLSIASLFQYFAQKPLFETAWSLLNNTPLDVRRLEAVAHTIRFLVAAAGRFDLFVSDTGRPQAREHLVSA